ncbi:MAG: N-methyl-L-tryptophan oxidase [Candidatus Hydrogenedentes bacterium]|nr:N-methyl-L-tryptophan oxidase [Candidatus Hydrogenedentota bacterium]
MYDAIVLGLGGMGSAAAYHLARRGQSVLGLEQYPLVHAQGSSHGQSRIIRQAYFEHPDYVPLLKLAYAHWEALAGGSSEEIWNLCGIVLAGRDEDAVIAGTRRAAAEHGLPLEELDADAAAARYPGLQPDPDMAVLFDPLGGYLRVEHCVRAHLDGARAAGAVLRDREAVLSWEASDNEVRVFTNLGQYTARNLVIAAGPWAGEMLSDLGLPLSAHRVVTAWFPEASPAHQRDAGAPVFAMQTEHGFFYGFPQLDERGVKVAEHRAGDLLSDPARVDRAITEDDVRAIRRFSEGYLHGVDAGNWTGNACIYTMTPDSDFIVDRHPNHANVFIAAGFSGHGFKFAAAIGSILADFCARGATEAPVGFLSLDRFRT